SNGLHSLYVLKVFDRLFPGSPKSYRRTALMHDAGEAYAPDMHSLVKHKLPDYLKMLRNIEDGIADKFELVWPEPKNVKIADGVMLSTELVQLMRARPHIYTPLSDIKIKKVCPEAVYDIFLEKWEELKP